MKIQPVDSLETQREPIRADSGKPVLKSRLKRLFDRQFPNVLRINEKVSVGEVQLKDGGGGGGGGGGSEFEPSSVCLDKMVRNFIEENNDKQSSAAVKCGRHRCNCFNGNSNDSSDDEFDIFAADSLSYSSPTDAGDFLKSLIPCPSVAERNLLADTARIVEKNKICKRKDDLIKLVTDALSALSYDASICISRWDKSPSFPAGEYEYIDVIVQGQRFLIDVDFRSEFEIARSTSNYKSILQSLPYMFVGKPDRLQQILSIVSEAAKQSLKKKGMHFPPWRKADYMRAKWLSPHTRATPPSNNAVVIEPEIECGELELIFGEDNFSSESSTAKNSGDEGKNTPVKVSASPWSLPAIKPRSCERGAKVVTGLASLLKEKP